MDTLTFAEPIDLDVTRYIYNTINNHKSFDTEQLANLNLQLKTMMSSIHKNKYNIVNYSHSKNMGIGRVYPIKNNSLASIKKIVRNTLCCDKVIDIDEDKSYATHTYNLAKLLGYNHTDMMNINAYICDKDNKIRNDIASYYNIDLKNAKMILNSVLFGKTLKNTIIANDIKKNTPIHPFVKSFVDEISNVKNYLCNHHKYTHLKNDIYKKYTKTNFKDVPLKDRLIYKTLDKYNHLKPSNTLFSYILQNQEYLSLQAKLDALIELNAIEIAKIKIKGQGNKNTFAYLCSLAHDGIMIFKKNGFNYDTQFFNELSNKVRCKLNYDVYNLSIKPTDDKLDIDFEDYEAFKQKIDDDTTTNHFIRKNISDATAGKIIINKLKDILIYDDNTELWYYYENGYFKTINKQDIQTLILKLFGNDGIYSDDLFTLQGHYFNTDKTSKIINFIKYPLTQSNFYTKYLHTSKGYILFQDKILKATTNGIELMDHTPSIKFFVKPIELNAQLLYDIHYNKLGTYKENGLRDIHTIKQYSLYVENQIFKEPYDNELYGKALQNYIIRSLFGLFIGEMDKIFLTMRGGANSSKGVITNWLNICVGELIGELNGDVLCSKYNKEADDAKALAPFVYLLSKRLVVVNELSKSAKYNTNLFKKLSSGGDTIIARALFKNQVSVPVCFKLLCFMNDWLVAEDGDDALMLRNKAIEMNYTFGSVEDLENKIKKGDTNIKNICETDIKYRYAFLLTLLKNYSYTHQWDDIVEHTSKTLTTKNIDDKLQIIEMIMGDAKEYQKQYILCKFNNIEYNITCSDTIQQEKCYITTDEMSEIYNRLVRAYPKKYYKMGFKLKRDFIDYLNEKCGVVKHKISSGVLRKRWVYVGIQPIADDDDDDDDGDDDEIVEC